MELFQNVCIPELALGQGQCNALLLYKGPFYANNAIYNESNIIGYFFY